MYRVSLFLFVALFGAVVGCADEKLRLLSWRYSETMAPAYSESQAEKQFKTEVVSLMEKNDAKFCYLINVPNYFVLHGLPFFHVLPAPLCGVNGYQPARKYETPESMANILQLRGYSPDVVVGVSSHKGLRGFVDSGQKNAIISTVGEALPWQDKIIFYSHGVDEDDVYLANRTLSSGEAPWEGKTPSLLFTKFVEEKLSVSPSVIKEYYKLDPNKKTIFYAATYGNWEFIDSNATPEPIWRKMLEQLVELKKDFNIIFRPHPQIGEETIKILSQHFILAPTGQFPSFVPFYQVADLVIGTPSSVTTSATSRPELPIVLLRPTKTWKWGLNAGLAYEDVIIPMKEIADRNQDLVLGEKTAIVMDEISLDLRSAVERAFAQNTPERIAARKNYFNYWFGCIDGYEEYRTVIGFLRGLDIDVKSLEKIYKTFPLYKNQPICQV